ncbi:hypothetical protein HMF7854_04590 [Sphingomonas ginkgonis]|uniref:Cupin domain-containing protein n=1 Tax=Sphingomonas ginkgonis TaxID=2315330 RepID=A0A3R9WPB4_9SPHN|nr:hypothetical protein [Sphingomonas ginkgonis]RST30187.1 hypothetical protein HMF7854_04590 [Sphingomonas ginkgonis]
MSLTPMKTKMPLLAAAAMAIAGLGASRSSATPPVNWGGETLVKTNLDEIAKVNDERIKFQTKDPIDTQTVRLEWSANGSSVWHHHPGMVLVQVASGTIVVTREENGRCTTQSYGPGESFVEGDSPHVGTSVDGAVAYAVALVADGQPGRVNDDAPACASGPGVRTPG